MEIANVQTVAAVTSFLGKSDYLLLAQRIPESVSPRPSFIPFTQLDIFLPKVQGSLRHSTGSCEIFDEQVTSDNQRPYKILVFPGQIVMGTASFDCLDDFLNTG